MIAASKQALKILVYPYRAPAKPCDPSKPRVPKSPEQRHLKARLLWQEFGTLQQALASSLSHPKAPTSQAVSTAIPATSLALHLLSR